MFRRPDRVTIAELVKAIRWQVRTPPVGNRPFPADLMRMWVIYGALSTLLSHATRRVRQALFALRNCQIAQVSGFWAVLADVGECRT
jgi:hypothetical protein